MEDQSTKNIAEVVATKVWYGIAMAAAFIIFGIPYLYFYSQLPTSLTVWLDPRLFIILVLATAVVVVKIINLTQSSLKRRQKSQSST